jgi:cytochrome c biogenesis protein CcdA
VVVDRLEIATPVPTVIVLLTATHFHFAGLGLLGLASLLARSRPWLRASVVGLIVGIPLTALGFVLATNLINSIGAGLVGLSGIGAGVALLTEATPDRWRWASRFAGAALLISMPLAIGWSLAILTGQPFLDLDTMIRTHGELNALAVVLGIAASQAEAHSAPAMAVPGIGTA